MKYSVIIPVYKAENTIKKCIDSLLNQPHKDVEILIINDGSPDRSGEICKEYAAHHSCIKYFEKENGGVSSARNIGLREAVGDYILFVDSDDYVSPNYFSKINEMLDHVHPDMLMFGIQYVGNKNGVWNTGNYTVTGELEVAKKIEKAVKAYLFSNLFSKTFDRKIINKYRLMFDESLSIGEDQVFVFKYALHINKIASIPDVLYHFINNNEDSLSRKRRDYLSEQLLTVNLEMLSALKESSCSEKVKKIHFDSIVWTHYRSAYSACKELLKFELPDKKRKEMIKHICEMYTLKEMSPLCLKSKIIAFPITHKMSLLIDVLGIYIYRRRQI